MKTNILKFIKAGSGFIWVIAFSICGIMIFMGIGKWIGTILKAQNVEILPKFNGGRVISETQSADYLLLVHEPVHDGVFVESKTTYVQIDWLAKESLPGEISENIDYNMDGSVDLKVDIDTVNKKISYDVLNEHIGGLVDRRSLAEFSLKPGKEVLFMYQNRIYKETNYGKGLSIRLIIEP